MKYFENIEVKFQAGSSLKVKEMEKSLNVFSKSYNLEGDGNILVTSNFLDSPNHLSIHPVEGSISGIAKRDSNKSLVSKIILENANSEKISLRIMQTYEPGVCLVKYAYDIFLKNKIEK